MRSHLLTLALCVAFPVTTAAQSDSATPTPARTTRSGIFSADQAAKGKDVYLGQCQSCHTAASLTAADFVANWNTKPLAELFTYLVENMPESEPGSLSKVQYSQVVAYILQLNNMPAGEIELAAEAESLQGITIDIAAAPPGPLPAPLAWLKAPVSRRTAARHLR
jgi:mono/diheme cytochrome c family protein